MGTIPNGLFHYLRMAQFREKAAKGLPVPAHTYADWHAYNAVEVARRVGSDGRQLHTCVKCRLPIKGVGVYWQGTRTYVVTDTGTPADGLSYCPPDGNARARSRVGPHVPAEKAFRL